MNYLIVLMCLLSTTLSAAIPPGKWQCFAFDEQKNSYEAFGLTLQNAKKGALLRCKKESSLHRSCKTAESFCEQGPIALSDDRCIVSDQDGHTWNGIGPAGCKAAMEQCSGYQLLQGPQSPCTIRHHEDDNAN